MKNDVNLALKSKEITSNELYALLEKKEQVLESFEDEEAKKLKNFNDQLSLHIQKYGNNEIALKAFFRKNISRILGKKEEFLPKDTEIFLDSLWMDVEKKFPDISQEKKNILRRKIYSKNFFKKNDIEIRTKSFVDYYAENYLKACKLGTNEKSSGDKTLLFLTPEVLYKRLFYKKIEEVFEKQRATEERKKQAEQKNLDLRKKREEKLKEEKERELKLSGKDDPFEGHKAEVKILHENTVDYLKDLLENFDSGDERNIRRYLLSEKTEQAFEAIFKNLSKKYAIEIEITDELKELMSKAKELELSEKKIEESLKEDENDTQNSSGEKSSQTKNKNKSPKLTIEQRNQKRLQKYLENPETITFDVITKTLKWKGFSFYSDNKENEIEKRFSMYDDALKKKLLKSIFSQPRFMQAGNSGICYFSWKIHGTPKRLVATEDKKITLLSKDHKDYDREIDKIKMGHYAQSKHAIPA